MVRYRRNFLPGGTFFFTTCLADRRATTLTDQIDVLRSAVRAARAVVFFSIDAMVILPDHLHAIWTLPSGDADYPGRWRRVKSGFTQGLCSLGLAGGRDTRGQYGVWQNRYWEHTIRDDADFGRHVDYIHFNPVKHGLVARVAEWPYSSFHRYVAGGRLEADWGGVGPQADSVYGERREA